MLVSFGAPLNSLEEAILATYHIQNKIPYKKNGKTSYELWKGYPPNLDNLKVQGCLAKLVIPNPKKSKLAFKTINCMFIGYAKNSTIYRFLVLKIVANLFDKNNIIKSNDAKFFEDFFPMKLIVERSLPYVKGFSDPPNLRRRFDNPPNSGR